MRAKRVLFLLLVIVMVLSTIPAAASFDVPEGLYFRILQQDENGNFYVESDGGLCGADQKYPLSISYVCMCYVDEAGNETHLQLSDPNLSFPSFLDTSTL